MNGICPLPPPAPSPSSPDRHPASGGRKRYLLATIALCLIVAVAEQAVAGETLPRVKPDQLARIEAAIPKEATAKPQKPRKMLVLSYQSHNGGRFAGEAAMMLMAKHTGAFELTFCLDKNKLAEVVVPENLAKYDAVCVNNSTGGRVKATNGKTITENINEYVANGGGLVGIHAATDNAIGEVFGGFFTGHPWSGKVFIRVDDPEHTLTKVFAGEGFEVSDEIYQFAKIYTREKLRILLTLDMEKVKKRGKRADNDNAIAWVRGIGKGRVFYGSLGHNPKVFEMPKVMQFYLDGIQFALGDLEADATPSGPLPEAK